MEKIGVQHQFASLLLKRMRQTGQIDYVDEVRHDLAERLCELILVPWFWSEEDLKSRAMQAYRQGRSYYDQRGLPEDKALEDIMGKIRRDSKISRRGAFYPLKPIDSISKDLLNFLFETDEVAEVYADNGQLLGTFTLLVDQFKPEGEQASMG